MPGVAVAHSSCKVDRVVLRAVVTQLSLTEKVSCYCITECSITVPSFSFFPLGSFLAGGGMDDTNLMTRKLVEQDKVDFGVVFFMAMCTLSLSPC